VEVLAKFLLLALLRALTVLTEALLVRLESRVNCGGKTELPLDIAFICGDFRTRIQGRVEVYLEM